MANKDTRTRNWTVVMYPDSAPDNWRDLIDDTHIEWIESPLHEFDTNPIDGTVKKAHWHVLLMFGGVKSYEQVVEYLLPFNCPAPQRCHNAKSMVRYMAHLDHPHKYQYNVEDIVGHGGIDISDLLKPSSSERYSIIKDMMQYISDNNITEFCDLMDYAMRNEFDSWFPLLCDNSSYVIGQYIKSVRERMREAIRDNGKI